MVRGCVRGDGAGMGFRNYLSRTLILLALALAVAITVALMSADERAGTGHGGAAPASEHQTAQRTR